MCLKCGFWDIFRSRMCLRHVWKCKKLCRKKAFFPFKTPRLSPINRNLCCEDVLLPVIYSFSMRGRTGKLSFCVHVSSASMIESIHAGQTITFMIESIHAGQDSNVHVSSASMSESIHAGQDNNVHVFSASMFPKFIN